MLAPIHRKGKQRPREVKYLASGHIAMKGSPVWLQSRAHHLYSQVSPKAQGVSQRALEVTAGREEWVHFKGGETETQRRSAPAGAAPRSSEDFPARPADPLSPRAKHGCRLVSGPPGVGSCSPGPAPLGLHRRPIHTPGGGRSGCVGRGPA